MTGWIIVIVLLVAVLVSAWRRNPNRRKNIDTNVRKIVSAKSELVISIRHASEDLEKEYKHQLKGYKGNIQCYRDPHDSNTLILARR